MNKKFLALYLSISATIFTLTGFCQSNNYDPAHLYSVGELQTDFQYLRTSLEKTHPNLYLYTPKVALNLFFDSLYKCIINPLTALEFYNHVTLVNSKVKDGHTMLLPSEVAVNYFTENRKFFPIYIALLNNKLYVNMNCSGDTLMKEGAEIVSINGIDTKNILQYLFTRQIRDGNNQTYPIWILTNYFKEYFSFSFGHPELFSITYKSRNADTTTTTINALSKYSIQFYKQLKYSKINSSPTEKQGIILHLNKQSNTATLVIKSFDNDILKSVYKQNFDSTIQKMFSQIYNINIQNLILDVRNNQGGDFEPGKFLLSYLLRHSIKYLPGSKEYKIIKPKKNSFKGNLYILINGGSFSSTGILCSYLESTKRGIFIGEETSGNKIIISGDPVEMTLPNTKITATISTISYVVRDNYNLGQGVIPTYNIATTIDDIITDKDTIKNFALSIISMIKK